MHILKKIQPSYFCWEIWKFYNIAAAAKSLQSCLTLCNPINGSPPGSSVPGILQARILEWVAIAFSNACMHAKLLQLCLTLCDPMDSSPPGSSVHRILQARILESTAIPFSRGSSRPKDRTQVSCSGRQILHCETPGSPSSRELMFNFNPVSIS